MDTFEAPSNLVIETGYTPVGEEPSDDADGERTQLGAGGLQHLPEGGGVDLAEGARHHHLLHRHRHVNAHVLPLDHLGGAQGDIIIDQSDGDTSYWIYEKPSLT